MLDSQTCKKCGWKMEDADYNDMEKRKQQVLIHLKIAHYDEQNWLVRKMLDRI